MEAKKGICINFLVKLNFLWVGRTRDPCLRELEDRYLRRVRRFYPVDRAHVPEARKADPRQLAAQLEREARRLEQKIDPRGYLVCLDDEGEQVTSRQFAGWLEEMMLRGVSEFVFVIGGPWGVAQRIRERAGRLLSLSRMTLPHELARIVLLEQIYRAATLIKGVPYHR